MLHLYIKSFKLFKNWHSTKIKEIIHNSFNLYNSHTLASTTVTNQLVCIFLGVMFNP